MLLVNKNPFCVMNGTNKSLPGQHLQGDRPGILFIHLIMAVDGLNRVSCGGAGLRMKAEALFSFLGWGMGTGRLGREGQCMVVQYLS